MVIEGGSVSARVRNLGEKLRPQACGGLMAGQDTRGGLKTACLSGRGNGVIDPETVPIAQDRQRKGAYALVLP